MLWNRPEGVRRQRPTKFPLSTRGIGSRFLADTEGSLTVFTLFCFVLMLMICGIGVDLMRYEAKRVALQSTLDRAVLAAANLDQTLDPDDVVQDYFAKAGIEGATLETYVDDATAYRNVAAHSNLLVRPFFMQLVGVNSLTAPATGGAHEGMTLVEISLVVDISKSMDSNSRLTNLKVAAKEFVDTVIDATSTTDLTHISLVPFSTQVNAGSTLGSYLNFSGEHTHSYCADWTSDEYASTTLPTTITQAGHFDPDGTNLASSSSWRPVCMTGSNQHILAYQNDVSTLKNYIDGLSTDMYTSIEIGARWGAALLDPSMQSVVAEMVADGVIDNDFDGRPYAYGTQDTMKVMIVMSDGANTKHWELNDAYRSGLSNIWYSAPDSKWSVKNESLAQLGSTLIYWDKSTSSYLSQPTGSNAQQLTWAEVWAKASPDWIRANLMVGALGSSTKATTWYNGVFKEYDKATKDARTSVACQAAKDQGVTVYTIGFETDADGDAALKDCATSASHFFHASGTQISDVFAAIAADIGQLKLTY